MGRRRRSNQHSATIENIPDDILLNIFFRLLAKDLDQMRCVSKSWNSILYQSSFIKSHLDRSIQNNKNDGTLLVFPHLFSFASKPFTTHPSQSLDLVIPNSIKLPVSTHSNNMRGKIIGSFNGLICFKYGTSHDSEVVYGSNHHFEAIYIWNPSLSALLTLPPYHMPSHSIEQFFQFGFNPKTDDYKIVRITRPISISPDMAVYYHEWLPAEVYSMRKGSWKLTTPRIPSHLKYIYDFHDLCLDGHLHWVAGTIFHWNNYVESILACDLGAETFREIPLPDPLHDDAAIENYLGVLGGKLCVMSCLRNDECEVWVMKEYGVTESWVKRHFFPPFSGDIHPYGFTLHNEFIIQVVGRGLALYDPVASKTKIFKYCGEHEDGKVKLVEYVDSLVWVTPDEQHKMSCCSISQFQFQSLHLS